MWIPIVAAVLFAHPSVPQTPDSLWCVQGPTDPPPGALRALLVEPALYFPEAGAQVSLDLFDGRQVQLDVLSSSTDETATSSRLVAGSLERGELLMLSQVQGELAGSLWVDGAAYRLRTHPGQGLLFCELDPARPSLCHAPLHQLPATQAPDVPVAAGVDAVVDVLVVSTPAARESVGGEAGMKALLGLAELQTNLALQQSGAEHSVRILGEYEVQHTESGNLSTELNQLFFANDGFLDRVPVLREIVGADLTVLMVAGGTFAGVAWQYNGWFPGVEDLAYAVVRTDAAVDNLTFAHELGHLLGCTHGPPDSFNPGGVYPDSKGMRTRDEVYRTVMAYAPGERVPFFSGPQSLWQGYTLGKLGFRDNARTLRLVMPRVALFREAQLP